LFLQCCHGVASCMWGGEKRRGSAGSIQLFRSRWMSVVVFFQRDESQKGQDSDMEHAEKHKKSEKDLKSGHSAGKGKEGGVGLANEKKIQLPAGNAFSSTE
jgi:hypothetical protein